MNLFWKIFASFAIAMTVTLVGAVFVSSRLAQQAYEQSNIQGPELLFRANSALSSGGEPALIEWLKENDRPPNQLIMYVVNEHGDELLGRPIPEWFEEQVRDRSSEQQNQNRGGPFDRPRGRGRGFGFTLNGPDGQRYYYMLQVRPSLFGVLNWPSAQVSILLIAGAASALMALALARYLSLPIVRLQKASRALAAGVLDARVGGSSTKRTDEVGILARDFDAMADHIQELITAKETLLRDISHELRSPLARIRVALALAERHTDELARKDFERIELETERLDALVGQVMMLTRLRTQRAVRRDPVDLGECIAEIVENARFEHPDVGLECNVSKVPTVYGDEDELRSAIENIVRNALAYSGEGGKVEVTLGRDARNVFVRVADSGPGVPEGELERIFEPFYRTDQSRNHQHRGEGIGLAITASVMQRHEGSAVARNRPGGGLEIALMLPLGAGPVRPHASAEGHK